MAMAAELTVVEVDQMVELGEMDPRSGGHPEYFRRSHRRCWSKCMIPLTREQWHGAPRRICRKAPYVNLGIGIPTLAASYVPPGREVIFHSENGHPRHGFRSRSPAGEDPYMVDAGKNLTTLVPGGCFVHHDRRVPDDPRRPS